MSMQRCYSVYMETGKRLSIRFPLDLLERLKRYAQEDKRSINSEMVWILSDYAQRREKGSDDNIVQVPPVSESRDR